MSKKDGWSEEKTGFFGDKYIQHYDGDGNQAGWSKEETGLFGGKYTQDFDQSGSKSGWSEEQTGFFGGKYTQHHDQSGSKTGWSEGQTGFFGGKYKQHHDQSGEKTGWSEWQTGFFGGRYSKHHGRRPIGSQTSEEGETDNSPSYYSDSKSSGSLASGLAVLFAAAFFMLFLSDIDSRQGGSPRAELRAEEDLRRSRTNPGVIPDPRPPSVVPPKAPSLVITVPVAPVQTVDVSGTWYGEAIPGIRVSSDRNDKRTCQDFLTIYQSGSQLTGKCEFKDESGTVWTSWKLRGQIEDGQVTYEAYDITSSLRNTPEDFSHALVLSDDDAMLSGEYLTVTGAKGDVHFYRSLAVSIPPEPSPPDTAEKEVDQREWKTVSARDLKKNVVTLPSNARAIVPERYESHPAGNEKNDDSRKDVRKVVIGGVLLNEILNKGKSKGTVRKALIGAGLLNEILNRRGKKGKR